MYLRFCAGKRRHDGELFIHRKSAFVIVLECNSKTMPDLMHCLYEPKKMKIGYVVLGLYG